MPILEAIALMLLTPSATAATETSPATAETPAQARKPKPKKICKNDPGLTGTRISKRICKTEAEWAAKEDGQDIGVRSKTSRADMENVGGMGQP